MSKTITVQSYLENLNYPLKLEMLALKDIFLSIDPQIISQIKWNSLSFFYQGEVKNTNAKDYMRDLAVLNLNKQDYILIVLPNGTLVDDDSGILEGNFKDNRKMIKIYSSDQIKENQENIINVIKKLILKIKE